MRCFKDWNNLENLQKNGNYRNADAVISDMRGKYAL